MEIKELVKKLIDDKNAFTEIEVKTHIPFLVKREVVNTIQGICMYTDEETGFIKCDSFLRDLFFVLNIVLEVTNITCDDLFDDNGEIILENAINFYDLVKQNGIYTYIWDNYVFSAIIEIEELLEQEIKQNLSIHNSTANVLKKEIENLMKKIPSELDIQNLLKEIPEQLNSLQVLKPKKKSTTRKTTKK